MVRRIAIAAVDTFERGCVKLGVSTAKRIPHDSENQIEAEERERKDEEHEERSARHRPTALHLWDPG